MRAAWFLLLLACTPARAPDRPPPPSDGGSAALAAAEKPMLASLAIIDARLERRVRQHASEAGLRKMATELILEEDTQAALVEGRIDMFSFDARERALAKLGVPAMELAETSTGELKRPKLEGELLMRLLEAEKARVEIERDLPASASELVRGVVETWEPAADDAVRTARDAWLTRRMGEIEDSLERMPMPRDEQYELEDALDPLENELHGYTKSTQALAHLRVALGSQQPSSPTWDSISRALAPHIGTAPPAETLIARLEPLERSLRPAVQPKDEEQHAVKKLLLEGRGPCALEGRGSLVRALGVPPEREVSCRVIRGVVANDPAVRLAMHRVVALAITTILAHTGVHRDLLPGVLQSIPLLGVRAAGNPVPFIIAALTIERLLAAPDPATKARAWIEFGDAPLDVALREIR